MLRPIWGTSAAEINVNGERWLAIADVHLGFEFEYIKEGVYIPDQTERMAGRLLSLGKEYDKLVIVGDLKHSIGMASWSAIRVRRFLDMIVSHFQEILLVQGNHDGGISELLKSYKAIRIVGSKGFALGDVWIFHGHARPLRESQDFDIGLMGHVHPSIKIRGRGKVAVWVLSETKCDGLPGSLVVMPPFNELLGYGDLLDLKQRGPVFPKCIELDSTEIFTLDGGYMGTLEYLVREKDLLSLT